MLNSEGSSRFNDFSRPHLVALIVLLVIMRCVGLFDSEFGARGNPYGFSVYFALPLKDTANSCKISLATLILVFIAALALPKLKSARLRIIAVLGILLIDSIRVLYSAFAISAKTMSARKFNSNHKQSTLSQTEVYDAPCINRRQLPISEYIATHKCQPESSIQKSFHMLTEAPTRPAVNKTAMAIFSNLSLPSWERTHHARIQIVRGGVYLTPLAKDPHSSTLARYMSVIKAIMEILRECQVLDMEFFLRVHDGFQGSYWPLKTDQGDLYIPLLVQEKHRDQIYKALLITPRSVGHDGSQAGPGSFVDFTYLATLNKDIPWDQKKNMAVWRGSPTGGVYEESNWRTKPRTQLVLLSKQRPDLLDAKFVNIQQAGDEKTKKDMREAGLEGNFLTYEDQNMYKAVIIVDGNSLPDRFPYQLATKAVMFKQESPFVEFWYDELIPWVHYVPFKQDFSDLEAKLIKVLANDTFMQEVAHAANAFVLEKLSPQRMKCFWAQLLQEYPHHVEQPIVPLPDSVLHCP